MCFNPLRAVPVTHIAIPPRAVHTMPETSNIPREQIGLPEAQWVSRGVPHSSGDEQFDPACARDFKSYYYNIIDPTLLVLSNTTWTCALCALPLVRDVIYFVVSSVRISSVYQGLIEIRSSTHIFKFFIFFRF